MRRDPDGRPVTSAPDGPSPTRVHLWIRGHVQGVGFRFFVQRRAQQLGLTGFVRNLNDRRVEVAVEGPRENVDALIDAVQRGPSGASVRDVEVRWEAIHHDADFVILTDDRA